MPTAPPTAQMTMKANWVKIQMVWRQSKNSEGSIMAAT